MLERTASSLESCNLQRVLAGPARSARRRRQLHTGFWQHGASAIELSSIWPPTPTPAPAPQPSLPDRSRQNADGPGDSLEPPVALVASAFLLDFLYPTAARSLLNRIYDGAPRRRVTNKTYSNIQGSRFVSTPVAEREEVSQDTYDPSSTDVKEGRAEKQNGADERSTTLADRRGHAKVPTANTTATTSQRLDEVLSNRAEDHFQDVWDLYARLNPNSAKAFRTRVVIYLSRSTNVVDHGRAVSAARRVAPEDWDNRFLGPTISSYIKMGNMGAAIDLFRTAVETRGLCGGLSYILLEFASKEQWQSVLEIWLFYFESLKNMDNGSRPEAFSLTYLKRLPKLRRSYVSFVRYMGTQGIETGVDIETSKVATEGLASFWHKFAELVLTQPCSPDLAAVILNQRQSSKLYSAYIMCMIRRWRQKLELDSTMTIVGKLYREYRDFPDAQPGVKMLHSMFDVYFPEDRPGIELVYQDWMRYHGSLDINAYEQFLKSYAKLGDVGTVEKLWHEFTTKFPEKLKSKWIFNPLLNAVAQTGDSEAYDRKMQELSSKYGYEAGPDTSNMLLKSHVKAGEFDKAVQCFERIREDRVADAFTYTHMLTISAKRGDLDSTLEYLRLAQEDGVHMSNEMSFSLVWAYCENDQLDTAEKICLQLTSRKATDSKAWNALLHFHSMQGHAEKCYQLFDAMKQHGIHWDGQTCEFMMQAMVQAGQVSAAHDFLRRAYNQSLFPLRAEHFAVVMSRAAQLEPTRVESLRKLMFKANIAHTFQTRLAFFEAAHRAEPHSPLSRSLRADLVQCLRDLASRNDKRPGTGPREVRELRRQTHGIGRAIALLVKTRDFDTVEELVSAYMDLSPRQSEEAAFGPDVSAALMEAFLSEGLYERVHELWRKIWEAVVARAQLPRKDGVYPARQYDLCPPMDAVVQAFRAQNDGNGLLKCTQEVLATGFKLTSALWNRIIQELSYMGHWEEAMEYCETMLMPRWGGWRSQVPRSAKLAAEQQGNSRVLHPSKKVVLALQSEWLRRQALAAWSSEMSRRLGEVEMRFPTLYHAFTQSDYIQDGGLFILEGKVNPGESIDGWLSGLSRKQLKAVEHEIRSGLRSGRSQNAMRSAHAFRSTTRERQPQQHAESDNVALDPVAAAAVRKLPAKMSSQQVELLLDVVQEELDDKTEQEEMSESSETFESRMSRGKKEGDDEEKQQRRSFQRGYGQNSFKIPMHKVAGSWTEQPGASKPRSRPRW